MNRLIKYRTSENNFSQFQHIIACNIITILKLKIITVGEIKILIQLFYMCKFIALRIKLPQMDQLQIICSIY